MTNEDFEIKLKDILTKTRETLTLKASHYAHGDRLSNFNRAAEALRCTPARALVGMMQKHDVATLDYVDMLEKGKMIDIERWKEVLGDAINYRILLLGMMMELWDKLKADEEARKREEVENGDVH